MENKNNIEVKELKKHTHTKLLIIIQLLLYFTVIYKYIINIILS